MVKSNGKLMEADGMKLVDYLASAGYDEKKIAVEINEEIVPKSCYSETKFCDGDTVEVVSFVGGG